MHAPSSPCQTSSTTSSPLHAMFYSQRINNRKRRLGNPSAFDQSWRRRPLTIASDDGRDVSAEIEPQMRKRSKTHAATTMVMFQEGIDFNFGQPRETLRAQGPAVPTPPTPVETVATAFPENVATVLDTARILRRLVLDDEDEEDTIADVPTAASPGRAPSPLPAAHDRNDSVIQLPPRERRHGRKPTPRTVLATRTDIQQIANSRANMGRAELSLRSEIFHQERYLRARVGASATPGCRQMAQALRHNRDHLIRYMGGSNVASLPQSVRERMGGVEGGSEA